MKNSDLSPYFKDLEEHLSSLAGENRNLFLSETKESLKALRADFTNIDELIETVQNAMRIASADKAGLLSSQPFADDLKKYKIPSWKNYAPLAADTDMQATLGRRLFNVPAGFPNAHIRVMAGEGSNHIIAALVEMIHEQKIPYQFAIADTAFTRVLFNHISDEDLKSYAQYWMEQNDKITHSSIAYPNATASCPIPALQEGKDIAYRKMIEPVAKRSRTGEVMFTLTYFPTEIDAEIDGIPYNDYLNLFFEMCDQPDAWIEKANDVLISKFENASEVRFTNKQGTDITMSLIDTDGRHFTFANSQTKKNIPGSEVFSAPRRDSLNGTIVSHGKFMPKSDKDKQIVNLTLRFEHGKIVDFDAEEGKEHFEAFLNRDPNNYYVGELGIGTNPHLKRHVANGLLVEKISSSFHLALGDAYTFTDYIGKPVHVNNGNESIDHWDVTTMLGDIYLDGQAIMKEGKFLDPMLDVLNRGWDAVPVEDRPDHWKNYKGPYTGKHDD